MIYPQDEEPQWRYKKLAIVTVILMVLGLLALGGWFVYKELFRAKKQPAIIPAAPEQKAEQIRETGVAGRYLFNGTTVWARAVEKYAKGDYAQPFSQLNTFNRAAYDGWSTDFECPITDNVVPYQTQIDKLVFNCRPEFLPEASKYFNLYDLANNHTDNQNGQAGIASTRAYMDKQPGVQYFGNFDPTITKDICEVIALPVRVQKIDNTEEKGTLPVAFCAWHYFNYFRGPTAEELAVVKQYADVMPVFGFVEMGNEYHATASNDQVTVAHQLVDTGLDFLLANNPHWVQNTEAYKGKLIVYSLGNFIFDQIDAETERGASLDTTLTIPYDDNLKQWLKLGPDCASFQDSCLQSARQKALKKVNIKLKYAVIASQGGAGKVTHKADAATQAAVEERMNWSATMKALGQ